MFSPLDRVVRLFHLPRRRHARAQSVPSSINRSSAETMAHVAHELRQPLSAAVAALRVMRSSADETRREHARIVLDRQLHRLVRLIDDLVDATCAGVHRPSMHTACVDVRTIAQELADAMTPEAAAKHQHLTLATPRTPVLVEADAARLQQVLSNLVTNAIKYTGPGGFIRISIAQNGREALLTVADSGQGIPRELMHRIFEPFVRADPARGHGLGVGLAVVRQLVDLHHGRIHVESQGSGRGSTFTVAIPSMRVPSPASAASANTHIH